MDAKTRQHLIANLISVLISTLDDETMKSFANNVLDFAENYAKKTSNTYDDMIVNGLAGKIREAFGITDNK